MSVNIEYEVAISDITQEEIDLIDEILCSDDYDYNKASKYYHVYIQECMSSLRATDIHEFIRDNVWKLLKRFVPIEVTVIWIEQAPVDYHSFDKEDYEKFIKLGGLWEAISRY